MQEQMLEQEPMLTQKHKQKRMQKRMQEQQIP